VAAAAISPWRVRMVGSRRIRQAWSIAASAAVSVSSSRVAARAITRPLPGRDEDLGVAGSPQHR
jgi:hypothetical protein